MSTPTPVQVPPFDARHPAIVKFIGDLSTPWKMRLFFIRNLPSCWFWGVRVESITPQRAEVSIPFSWRTQNPFRSIYFAALAGAAELSTGLIASIALRGRRKMSMLITQVEANYVKKADTKIVFTCDEGQALLDTVQKALETQEAQTIKVTSVGRNTEGVEVAKITFTWSFKVKR
jgi:acyl-coenzyme A thioesterase PaaI-like protein